MKDFIPIFRINFANGQPNPLGILLDDPIYGSVRLPDMTGSFEDDLRGYWGVLANRYENVRRDHVVALLKYYFFDLLIEFKNKSNGIIPAQIVNDVFNQVIQVYSNMTTNDPKETIELVEQHVYYSFYDPNIINETRRYIATFN